MASFNKLNFFQFKWALLVLIVYYIGSGHCSPVNGNATPKNGSSTKTRSPSIASTSSSIYSTGDTHEEFDNFAAELVKTSEWKKNFHLTLIYLSKIPLKYKEIFLKHYYDVDVYTAYKGAAPDVLLEIAEDWAKSKHLDLANTVAWFKLNEITLWQVISPLFLRLSFLPNDAVKVQQITKNVDESLDNIIQYFKERVPTVESLTDVGKFAFKLAFSLEIQKKRLAKDNGGKSKNDFAMANDALALLKELATKNNLPYFKK